MKLKYRTACIGRRSRYRGSFEREINRYQLRITENDASSMDSVRRDREIWYECDEMVGVVDRNLCWNNLTSSRKVLAVVVQAEANLAAKVVATGQEHQQEQD